MPKMKTDKGAAKRIKVTGRGKLRRRHAFLNHLLEKKSPDRKRRLGAAALVVSHATSSNADSAMVIGPTTDFTKPFVTTLLLEPGAATCGK